MDGSLRANNATLGKYGEPLRNQLPIWLVSGNEELNKTVAENNQSATPSTSLNYPAGYISPNITFTVPSGNSSFIYLVGNGSAAPASNSTTGLDGRVIVKKVPINVTIAGGNVAPSGHYAYWAGDESIKANFAVRDRSSLNDTTYPNDGLAITSKEYRNRLQAPQRVGWENMRPFNNATLSFAKNDPNLEILSTTEEIPLLEPNSTSAGNLSQSIKGSYHSLTAYSRSLFTDPVLGGLKKDLTVYFDSTGGPNDSDPISNPALYTTLDPRLSAVNDGFPATVTNMPTFGQLKAWYKNNGAAGDLDVDAQTFPIPTRIRLFVNFCFDGADLYFLIAPVINLWNPYDKPLKSTDYELQFRSPMRPTNIRFLQKLETAAGDNFPGTHTDRGDKNNTVPGVFLPQNTTSATGDNLYLTRRMTPAANVGYYYNSNTTHGWSFNANGTLSSTFRMDLFEYDPALNVTTLTGNGRAPTDPNAAWVRLQIPSLTIPAGENLALTVNGHQNIPITSIQNNLVVGSLVNAFNNTIDGSIRWRLGTLDPISVNNYVPANVSPAPAPANIVVTTPTPATDLRVAIGNDAALGADNSIRLIANNLCLWAGYSLDTANDSHQAINPGGPLATAYNETNATTWRRIPHISNVLNANAAGVDLNQNNSGPLGAPVLNLTFPLSLGYAGGTFVSNAYFSINSATFKRAFASYNLSARFLDAAFSINATRPGERATDFLSPARFFNSETDAFWNRTGPSNSGVEATRKRAYFFPIIQEQVNSQTGLHTIVARRSSMPALQLTSLGMLQQANLATFAHQPSFVVANSEAPMHLSRDGLAGIKHNVGIAPTAATHSWKFPSKPTLSDLPLVASATTTSPFTPPTAEGPVRNSSANDFIDLSYLCNESLWDRYFLSTIPQTGTLAAIASGTASLSNSRIRLAETIAPTMTEPALRDLLRSYDSAAAHLTNFGALNVNCTDPEVWISLFTAFRNLKIEGQVAVGPTRQNPDNTVPVSRTLEPLTSPIPFTDAPPANVSAAMVNFGWATPTNVSTQLTGFRYLTDSMVRKLSERIVDEVRLRAPFFSVADFVNRRIVAPEPTYYTSLVRSSTNTALDCSPVDNRYDPLPGLSGINGALQRAINLSGINGGIFDPMMLSGTPDTRDRIYRIHKLPSTYTAGVMTPQPPYVIFSTQSHYADPEHTCGVPVGEVGQLLSHSPGFVTQADLLSLIGPALVSRGDTFKVRAYGDAVDPKDPSKLRARAWLEAIIQRTAEPVERKSSNPAVPDYWEPKAGTEALGRKFKIVKLRWLSEEEV